jgi:predicted nucleotidyltransferase
MRKELEKRCTELTERATKTFGDRLVSLILYGSGARGDHDQFSDLNILCVLRQLTPRELELAEPIFRWWRSLDNPAPLLLTLDEVNSSTDCFPIEFHDIQEVHRILAGADIVATLPIDDVFYRGRVEFEVRSKQLRLRQKAAGVLPDPDLLTKLMSESVSTFLTLGRHVLRLAGHPAPHCKRDIAAALEKAFEINPAPFYTLLDLREGKIKARNVEANATFSLYLQQIESLVASVDRLEK